MRITVSLGHWEPPKITPFFATHVLNQLINHKITKIWRLNTTIIIYDD